MSREGKNEAKQSMRTYQKETRALSFARMQNAGPPSVLCLFGILRKGRHFRGLYLVAISLRGGCVHLFKYQCMSLYIADLQFHVERDASRKVLRTASWFLVSPCWCRLSPSTLSLLDALQTKLQS